MDKSVIAMFFVFVIGMTLITSCLSTKVSSDIDSTKDFSAYKTYFLNNLDDNNLMISDLDQKRINQAITRELNKSGFTQVTDVNESDVIIDVNLVLQVNKSASANSSSMGYSTAGRRGYRGGGGMGSTSTSITTSQEVDGTLILDIHETNTDDMVWRGIVSKTLSSDISKREGNISKTMSKLFEKFPSGKVLI